MYLIQACFSLSGRSITLLIVTTFVLCDIKHSNKSCSLYKINWVFSFLWDKKKSVYIAGKQFSILLHTFFLIKLFSKPLPIRFKSYRRVSQILLTCTSPGVRPYISCCQVKFPYLIHNIFLLWKSQHLSICRSYFVT